MKRRFRVTRRCPWHCVRNSSLPGCPGGPEARVQSAAARSSARLPMRGMVHNARQQAMRRQKEQRLLARPSHGVTNLAPHHTHPALTLSVVAGVGHRGVLVVPADDHDEHSVGDARDDGACHHRPGSAGDGVCTGGGDRRVVWWVGRRCRRAGRAGGCRAGRAISGGRAGAQGCPGMARLPCLWAESSSRWWQRCRAASSPLLQHAGTLHPSLGVGPVAQPLPSTHTTQVANVIEVEVRVSCSAGQGRSRAWRDSAGRRGRVMLLSGVDAATGILPAALCEPCSGTLLFRRGRAVVAPAAPQTN